MKLKLTSLLVAVMVSAGVHAADSAREDTDSASRTRTREISDTSDSKRSIKASGVAYLLKGLVEVIPLYRQDNYRIWNYENMSPTVLAMLRTGGSIVEWGDVQAYRAGRLAWLAERNTPVATRASEKLRAIKDEAGIRNWAIREADAIYIQSMHSPQSNHFQTLEMGGRPFISSAEYLDIWRPTIYSYGWMANNVECALAGKVNPDNPRRDTLAAELVDAFFELPESAFEAPPLIESCPRGTLACQPIAANNEIIAVGIGEASFKVDGQGVSIWASGTMQYFGEGKVCGRDWSYSEDLTKAESVKDAKANSSTTTKGNVIIKRKKVTRPRE